MKHRPIGLGIQGLADAIVLLKIPYDSEECLEFNSKVMETIYLASMTASNNLAKTRYELMVKLIQYKFDYPDFYDKNLKLENEEMNKLYHILKPNKYELNKNPDSTTIGAYSSFDGSQFSKGIFQFDLWSVKPFYEEKWNVLKKNVMKYGTRNSLLTSLMPTASTSQILGNNECFEFFTNNIYTRNTQAGDFVMVNKYLVSDLNKVGLWNTELKDKIIGDNGSIQNLDIPNVFKELYKTIWEIKQVWVLKGAAARGPFVDQTQSMNIFMAEPDYQRLGSSHFWAWKNGLKTGMYYLRTKPSSEAIKITVSSNSIKEKIDCETCSA
jgi:ribonucleoside-diphosphate reductase alpha chain